MSSDVISRQLQMLIKGAYTKRFHTVPTIMQETVGHHSMLVAGLLYILWPEKQHLLIHAIMHDLPEHVTGDTPSPGKRMFVDRDRLKSAEYTLMVDAGLNLPKLSPEDERYLKIADILAGMITCSQEVLMGNRMVVESMENYASYLKEIGPHTQPVMLIAHRLYQSTYR